MTAATRTKADIFLATCILYLFLAVLSFMYATSDDTKQSSTEFMFSLMLIPLVHAANYLGVNNFYLAFFLIVLNMLLYALLFIKLFSRKLSVQKKYKPFTPSFIVGCVIPAIIILGAVYGIAKS